MHLNTEKFNLNRYFLIILLKKKMKKIVTILLIMTSFNSINAQKNISVVPSVDLNRYSGTWYEIARLPIYFESKLKCITATYILREDGNITVVNKGHYVANPEKTNTAKGKAFIPDRNSPGKLKVQFFWPFKGDYWIMYLDKEYKYVLIGEPSFKYLWILAREKKMDESTFQMLSNKAVESGYDLSNLIRTVQDCN